MFSDCVLYLAKNHRCLHVTKMPCKPQRLQRFASSAAEYLFWLLTDFTSWANNRTKFILARQKHQNLVENCHERSWTICGLFFSITLTINLTVFFTCTNGKALKTAKLFGFFVFFLHETPAYCIVQYTLQPSGALNFYTV